MTKTKSFAPALALGLALACGAAACGGDESPDAAPRPDAHIAAGNISLVWTVNGQSGADACSAVGASLVQVSWASTGGIQGDSDTFSCSSAMGTTKDVQPGTYNVTVTLVGGNQDLAEEMAMQVTVEDEAVADAGAVDFTVSATGGFRLTLAASSPGPNCGLETDSPAGAGIVGFVLELSRGGTCQPITLSSSTGSDVVLDCLGGQVRCIEKDEELSASGLDVGSYTLSIAGFEAGDQECYSKDSPFSVPGGDAVTNLGAVSLPISTTNLMCVAP